MGKLVICVLLVVEAVRSNPEKYEGHQLYRVAGPSQEFARLEDKLDLLGATTNSGQLSALIRLSPKEKEQWLQYFDSKDMTYTKIADNLADIIREEKAKIQVTKAAALRRGHGMSWDTYYRHEEINKYLDKVASEHSNVITIQNAALSYEGRQIKYAKISTTQFNNHRKPVVIIDATIHAREWVTAPVALYIIDRLVVYRIDHDLLEYVDWIIIPVVNPDGYEYSMNVDRLWRKTRSVNHSVSCEYPGVDGNRNYDHSFGTAALSSDPCSLIYEGPYPFSEVETRVVRDLVLEHLDRVALYISLHSFGSKILYPWSNNGTLPANGHSIHLAGMKMAKAINALAIEKAQNYQVGNAGKLVYFATGTSKDWARAVGVPFTYTLELPGYDFWFIVPPEYIEQIVTETWPGIVEGAYYVLLARNKVQMLI